MVMKEQVLQRRIARLTGFSIVIMAVVAGAVMGLVFNPIFEAHISERDALLEEIKPVFLWGTMGWVIILITDLIASWGLYSLYRDSKRIKATVMGGARLIYSLILLVGIVSLFHAYAELNNVSEDTNVFFERVLSFRSVWQFGLIIFGIHLILLSQLVYDKKNFQKILSALLLIAGIGYFISNTASLLIGNYELYRSKVEVVFIAPMILGELILAVWLLMKGGKKYAKEITLEQPVAS